MKTKILITSILLAVFGTILVGYLLVGCSSRKGGVSRQQKEMSDEEIAWAQVREQTESQFDPNTRDLLNTRYQPQEIE